MPSAPTCGLICYVRPCARCSSLMGLMAATGNWSGREGLIRFCVDAADERSAVAQQSPAVSDAAAEAQLDDQPFAREVLVRASSCCRGRSAMLR
jgi:hypothetical protein